MLFFVPIKPVACVLVVCACDLLASNGNVGSAFSTYMARRFFSYIALAFSIFKTSGPRKQRLRPVDQENKGNWQWRSTLDSKGRSHFISQGLQFGHKQSNFKIFSLQVIRNVFLKNNCIKINFMMYSSNTVDTKVNLFEFITEHNKILILIQQFDLFFSVI